MGNVAATESSDPLVGEVGSEGAVVSADGSCQHINRAISILLMDRTISNRALINKAQCICYYCNPLSRLVFCRGKRKDVLANRSVKIALNFSLKEGDSTTAQQVTNTYRRLFYGADSNTLQRVLATKRFFSRATRFVLDTSGNLVEDVIEQFAQAPYDRLNYSTGLLEKFTQNQVFFTPEPELAFQYGSHPSGRICLQVLFDTEYAFQKGQCTLLPDSEGIIRKGSLNKDVRAAEEAAQRFRETTTFAGNPDSEVDYYLNCESLFDQQAKSASFYIFAIYFRFETRR